MEVLLVGAWGGGVVGAGVVVWLGRCAGARIGAVRGAEKWRRYSVVFAVGRGGLASTGCSVVVGAVSGIRQATGWK